MKKYIKKHFDNGEEYFECSKKGYPNFWNEFKSIVNECNTVLEINICLMDSKLNLSLPMLFDSLLIFNPIIFDFLQCNSNYLEAFYNGHIEGEKDFKKKYFKKIPNKKQTDFIRDKFNEEFKEYILTGRSFFNESTIKMAGYENGILTAYWSYENAYESLFKKKFIKENIPGKVYALVYIMDCFANGEKPLTGQKKKLISELNRKFDFDKGESIYSRYKEIFVFDFNKESTFIEIAGEQWQKILFELSENPNQLEQYLKDKKLIF
ncbi:MAG: hypothetical protein WBA59_12355 [Moheibacter sp.]